MSPLLRFVPRAPLLLPLLSSLLLPPLPRERSCPSRGGAPHSSKRSKSAGQAAVRRASGLRICVRPSEFGSVALLTAARRSTARRKSPATWQRTSTSVGYLSCFHAVSNASCSRRSVKSRSSWNQSFLPLMVAARVLGNTPRSAVAGSGTASAHRFGGAASSGGVRWGGGRTCTLWVSPSAARLAMWSAAPFSSR